MIAENESRRPVRACDACYESVFPNEDTQSPSLTVSSQAYLHRRQPMPRRPSLTRSSCCTVSTVSCIDEHSLSSPRSERGFAMSRVHAQNADEALASRTRRGSGQSSVRSNSPPHLSTLILPSGVTITTAQGEVLSTRHSFVGSSSSSTPVDGNKRFSLAKEDLERLNSVSSPVLSPITQQPEVYETPLSPASLTAKMYSAFNII